MFNKYIELGVYAFKEQVTKRKDYTVSVYDMEGVDYKVAVVRVNEKSCNLYYLDGVEFKFLSGLKSKDDSELTEDAIMSHVTIAFGNG